MNSDQLQKLQAKIKHLDSISTAPVILQPLLQMLRDPSDSASLEKIVKLTSYDGAIAAQCLRLANSPLFGCRQVQTVKAAILALGLDRIRSLLFGLCMNRVIPAGKWALDPLAFWRHSLGSALVAQRIAKRIGYPEPDQAYLAALLHDLGFLVNTVLYTAEFRKCVEVASAERKTLVECEQTILGFTHCDSGRLLCEHWRLPKDLCEAVRYHHDPAAVSPPRPLISLVHLSDLLCRVCGLGYGYEEIINVDLASDTAWQGLQTAYPILAGMDLVRFTLDIEGAMDQVVAAVDAIFSGATSAAGKS
jgi:HD-like signal output (HDOD) protein